MSNGITVCQDAYNFTKRSKATRLPADASLAAMGSVIDRNSPIRVARRGDESLNPEIEGTIVSNFSDPLAKEVQEAGRPEVSADSNREALKPGITVDSAPKVSISGDFKRTQPSVGDGRHKVAEAIKSEQVKTASAPGTSNSTFIPAVPAVPVTPASVEDVPTVTTNSIEDPRMVSAEQPVPTKKSVKIQSPEIGTMRFGVEYVSITDTVLSLGYLLTPAAVVYEPPQTEGSRRLTVTVGDQNFVCASLGISFEAPSPFGDTKVLWVVLIRDPQ